MLRSILGPRGFVALAGCLALVPSLGFGQTTVSLSDASGASPANGQAVLTIDQDGPDDLSITMQQLEPGQAYTVFLAASPESGAIPAQLLGGFRADGSGNGAFAVTTEIQDAFLPANPLLTNASGVAPPGAGSLAASAIAIPLHWIRINRASPAGGATGNVFGPSELAPGGAQIAASETSLDQDAPLAANIGPDISVRAPRSISDFPTIILDGAASVGDVVDYRFEVISTPPRSGGGTESLQSSCIVPFDVVDAFLNAPPIFIVGIPVATPVLAGSCLTNVVPPPAIAPSQAILVLSGADVVGYPYRRVFDDIAGESIVVRLTVTDSLGNTASDDLTINLTR